MHAFREHLAACTPKPRVSLWAQGVLSAVLCTAISPCHTELVVCAQHLCVLSIFVVHVLPPAQNQGDVVLLYWDCGQSCY